MISANREGMDLKETELEALLAVCLQTQEVELDCDECLAQAGRYAEAELAGKSAEEAFAMVRQHLAVCADCRQEYEALVAVLK